MAFFYLLFIYGNRHIEYSNECVELLSERWVRCDGKRERQREREGIGSTKRWWLSQISANYVGTVRRLSSAALSIYKKLTIVCCVFFSSLLQQQEQKVTGWNWDMMMINVTAYMKLLFIKIICERGEHRTRNTERKKNLWWKSMPRLCSLFDLRTPKIFI